MFDQMLLRRVCDHGFPVIDGEIDLSGRSLVAGKRDDGCRGKNVDMVSRHVIFASRPTVRKVRVDRQLHVRVWIAILRPRTFALAETRDNANANPSVPRRLHKCPTYRCHYPSPATGEEVHAEAGEKFPDFSTKSVVFIGTGAHYTDSLTCNY